MENTPKQTAVQWLYAKLEALRGELNYDLIDYEMYKIEKTRIYREALDKEKQQIKDDKTLDQKLFELANEFAVAGYGIEAVKLHTIHNNFNYEKTSNN